MPEFTHAEAAVIHAVRHLVIGGHPAQARHIRSRVQKFDGVSYDQANTALTRLVSRGFLAKPRRGYYVPSDPDDSAGGHGS